MSKPLLAIFNDIHVKEDNHELVIDLVKQIIQICVDRSIKYCVFNGDFFDSRLSQTLDNLLVFKHALNLFLEAGIKLIADAGNHDKRNLYSKFSLLSLFKDSKSEDFVLFEDEGFIELNGIILCFMPYFPEKDELLRRLLNLCETVEKYKTKKNIVLFMHAAVEGVRNNDGSIVHNDLKQEYFETFDQVWVAHYHNRQMLSDKIIYNGSTHQSNFGEDKHKGFTILNTDLSYEFIQSNFPRYRKLIFPAQDIKKARRMALKLGNKSDRVRFIFKGSSFQLERINKTEFESQGIEVKFENITETLVPFNSLEEVDIVKHDKKSLMKGWIEYCNGGEVDQDIKSEVFVKLQKLS